MLVINHNVANFVFLFLNGFFPKKWPILITYRKEKLGISPVFVICVMVEEFTTSNKYAVALKQFSFKKYL